MEYATIRHKVNNLNKFGRDIGNGLRDFQSGMVVKVSLSAYTKNGPHVFLKLFLKTAESSWN